MHHDTIVYSFFWKLGHLKDVCVYVNLQEPFHGIDADDGSMCETDFSPTFKGDNNTDLSWTSTPVSLLTPIK